MLPSILEVCRVITFHCGHLSLNPKTSCRRLLRVSTDSDVSHTNWNKTSLQFPLFFSKKSFILSERFQLTELRLLICFFQFFVMTSRHTPWATVALRTKISSCKASLTNRLAWTTLLVSFTSLRTSHFQWDLRWVAWLTPWSIWAWQNAVQYVTSDYILDTKGLPVCVEYMQCKKRYYNCLPRVEINTISWEDDDIYDNNMAGFKVQIRISWKRQNCAYEEHDRRSISENAGYQSVQNNLFSLVEERSDKST